MRANYHRFTLIDWALTSVLRAGADVFAVGPISLRQYKDSAAVGLWYSLPMCTFCLLSSWRNMLAEVASIVVLASSPKWALTASWPGANDRQ